MQTPAVVPIPHVGGPIVGPGEPRVLIGGLPAARIGDFCVCVGPPAPIALGSFTVMIGGKPAARVGDMTGHGGTIMPPGCPTVLIGDAGGGAGSPSAFTMGAARAKGAAFTRTQCESRGTLESVQGSPLLFTGDPTKKSWIEIELVDQKGRPVAHERFRVKAPGLDRPLEGFLDDKGFARIGGIDPGTCVISFPNLDAASWKPEKGPPARPVRPIPPGPDTQPSIDLGSVGLTRRVAGAPPSVDQDSVAFAARERPAIVADSIGLASLLSRPAPSVDEGTVELVARPGVALDSVSLSTTRRVVLDDALSGPATGLAVTVSAGGTSEKVQADGDGAIVLPLRLGPFVDLSFDHDEIKRTVRLFLELPPADTSDGAWRRLVNLGYVDQDGPPGSPPRPEALQAAAESFQADHGLAVTGQLDATTAARLADAHEVEPAHWRDRAWAPAPQAGPDAPTADTVFS